jgi:hypothetical protein
MEAAVALGVVSSIIAIAQLTAKLTITTGKLINSAGDSLPENEWIEEVAQTNRDLTTDLNDTSNASGPLSKIDSAVAKLARRCLDESAALIALLEKLKVPLRSDGTKSKRGAAKMVFKTMLRHGGLERRHKQLVSLERQLAALLLYAIKMSLLQGFEELRDLVERNGRDCVAVVRDSHTLIVEKLAALELGIQTVGRSVDRVGQSVGRVEQGVGRVEQGVGRAEEGISRAEKSIGRVELRQLNDIEQKRVEVLLQSLAYNGMDSRREMIVDPIGSTYDWAFNDDKQSTKQWLNSAVQHCWISGEPGTGKSVFTKSFRLDRRTVVALQTQTGKDNLLILDHYFWIAGDSQQRSLRAMLQHLCFQALQQYSALAEVAFPDEWTSGMPLRGMSWTTGLLLAALKRITSASGFQTYLVIDGLDECESKERPELIRLLLDLAKTSNTRLFFSSRPWFDFEKAFSDWSRLKLLENNSWDIFQLVCCRLELADSSTFRALVDDVRLFDVTCAGRNHNLGHQDGYKHTQDSLDPPQRLIHDLCLKADGNLLWVTVVLDSIYERLTDGQSVTEVMQYIVDLPGDVEDYYHDLVYTRIHSTYRTGKVSECAMALKILACVPDVPRAGYQRFELIRALQISINTRSGVAYDSEFFTKSPSPETSRPLDQAAYQSVCAFASSRCKDLMVTSKRHDQGDLNYQHRVIYDFVLSKRLQSSLDAAVPEHFRRPNFSFQLGILLARQLHERGVYNLKFHLWERLDFKGVCSLMILFSYLREYLKRLQGPLDQRAAQMCAELTTCIVKLRLSDFSDEDSLALALILDLARAQQFTPMSEIIRLGSKHSSNHTILMYVNKEETPGRRGPGDEHSPIRQVVPTSEPHTGLANSAPGPLASHYLPCESTWWTTFLEITMHIELEGDEGSVWSRSRAATYMARAFLKSGASVDIELCTVRGDTACRHVRICLDPTLHSKTDEYPEPSPQIGDHESHKHGWMSAKNILADRFGIPEAELLQFQAKNRSTRYISETDFLSLRRMM